MKIKKNFFKFLEIIIKSRWYFSRPKKSEVLIYDRNGANYLLDFLDKTKCFIYDCRGESINFFVLFASLLNFGFKDYVI